MPADPPDHLGREPRGPDQLELARTGSSRRRSISQGQYSTPAWVKTGRGAGAKQCRGHFWYGTNTARWAQTKGVTLFLLPTVNLEIKTVLELDPAFLPVYSPAGSVYLAAPSLLGGDVDKAEEMFRKGLQLDPRLTSARVGLARALIRKTRLPEARRELEAVLEEKAPTTVADWTMKDSRRAGKLLESIKGKP